MNVSGRKVIDPLFALHFAPFFEHKTSDSNYLGYNKYYKDKRSAIMGKIPDYELICIEDKGYKLARFKDRHVSSLCLNEITESIREICKKHLLNGKNVNDTIEISLTTIISEISDRYGFHLTHLLLKKASKIKRVSIKKRLDKEYNISNIIEVRLSDYL